MTEGFRPSSGQVKKIGLVALAGLAFGISRHDVSKPAQNDEKKEIGESVSVSSNPFFDNNPDYFSPIIDGEFSIKERESRTKRLPNGEEIFSDIGLDFYHVVTGDTLEEIRKRLCYYQKYAYLKHQTGKLNSFNIPDTELKAGMWLPVPLERKDRQLGDAEFAGYAVRAIDEILLHTKYGPVVADIILKIGESNLVATLIAVAKQESGGLPLGQFELHRWEKKYQAFSYSMFHILMNQGGAGLKARHDLGLTEGQTYHPSNAVKLYIGFMVEKTKDPVSFFPIDQHGSQFAKFYNGSKWETTNPNYVTDITGYYKDAQILLAEHPDIIDDWL